MKAGYWLAWCSASIPVLAKLWFVNPVIIINIAQIFQGIKSIMAGFLTCQYYFNGVTSKKTYWRHRYCWICSTMMSLLPSVLEGLQCRTVFLYLVRPRPGKFVFHYTRARSQQIYSSVPFPILSSYIKLTKVLIINYGTVMKTVMCTVWHVDKYKIIFKLVINSRRISRGPV